MNILTITLIGLAAGVLGTTAGSLISFLFKKPSCRTLSFILGFAGGIMISVVSFDLIPEAIEVGGITYGSLGVITGALIMLILDTAIPHLDTLCKKNENGHYVRTGILIA